MQSDKTAGFKLTGSVLGQMLGRHGLDDATDRAVEQTTILDTKTDPRRIERLHQLVDQLSDDQRAEVLALVTGMVMQAQLTARKAG